MGHRRFFAAALVCVAVFVPVFNLDAPSGSAVAFSPASLTGLKFWIDASDASTITSTAGAVSQVNDKSGNGRNITQSTSSEKPTIGSVQLNTMDVLTFDGTDSLASAPWTQSQPVTMFAVARNTENSGANRQIVGNTNHYCPVFYKSGNVWRLYAGSELVSGTAVDTNWHYLSGVVNGGSSVLHLDGSQIASGQTSTRGWDNDPIWIGNSQDNGYGFAWIGDIAEVFIYSRVLTAGEISQVESYLDTKWFGAPPVTTTTSTSTTTTTTTSTTTTTTTTTTPATTTTTARATTTTAAATTTTASSPGSASTTTAAPALVINVQAPTTTSAPVTAATSAPDQMFVTTSTAPAAARGTRAVSSTTPPTSTSTTVAAAPTTLPAPVEAPSAPQVQPGQAVVRVGDKDAQSSVTRENNQVVVASGDVTARLSAIDRAGQVQPLDSAGNIRLQEGSRIQLNMAGFAPGSDADVWMMSKPVMLGTARVDPKGSFSGTFVIPGKISPGSHRIVVKATTASGEETTITVGVLVGDYKKESGIATWLIVIPIILAVFFALFIPAVRRNRGARPLGGAQG